MKAFVLLAIGLLCLACSQPKEKSNTKLSTNFFYGAWGDSLASEDGGEGIILGTENDFYIITDGDIVDGDGANEKLAYKLILDRDPIEVEISIRNLTDNVVVKTGRATIKVIDSLHIYWKLFDENGRILDSARLTRAPNM